MFIACLLAATIWAADADNGAANQDMAHQECGVLSLYTLLGLLEKHADLESIKRLLPADSQNGRSMAELQSAASVLGVHLRGFRLDAANPRLDRPAIVYFEMEEGDGHYLVAKPVGIDGTMVQIIDYPEAPQVIDFSEFVQHSSWTGLILAPWSRGEIVLHYLKMAGLVGFSVCSAVLAFRFAKPRFGDWHARSRRATLVSNS